MFKQCFHSIGTLHNIDLQSLKKYLDESLGCPAGHQEVSKCCTQKSLLESIDELHNWRDPPKLWGWAQISPGTQIRGIINPTNRIYFLQKLKKEKISLYPKSLFIFVFRLESNQLSINGKEVEKEGGTKRYIRHFPSPCKLANKDNWHVIYVDLRVS